MEENSEGRDNGLCWCGWGSYKPHRYSKDCELWEEQEGEKARSVVAREHWLLARVNELDVDPAEPALFEVVRDTRALVRELGAERLEGVGALALLSQEVRALRLSLQELLLRAIHATTGSQTFEDAGLGAPAVEWQRKLAATEHALALSQRRCAELESGTLQKIVAMPASERQALEQRCAELEERARAAEAEANKLRASTAHQLLQGSRS